MPISYYRMFKNVSSKSIANGSEYVRKTTARKILRWVFKRTKEPYIGEILTIIDGCQKNRRCNSAWCPQCSNPRASRSKRKTVEQEPLLTSDIARLTTTDARSNEYRVRGGQRMMSAFDGLPLVMCHPVTINIKLVHVDGSIAEYLEKIRSRLRRMLDKMSAGAICRGKFDIVLKYLDELEFVLPEDDWPMGVDPKNPPHERYIMLHFHGVIFDSFLTHRQLRDVITDEFPGANRVCVKRAQKTKVLPDGTLCAGLQGYLEYASMEKIDILFGDESADAVLEYAKIDSTWKRANRNFSFGKQNAATGATIDQGRVRHLEQKARLDKAKKNWSKLSFAERFIHQWFSNASEIADTAKQTTTNRSDIKQSFNKFYHYHCNWCQSIYFEVVEFLDFLGRSKSELAKLLPKMVPE